MATSPATRTHPEAVTPVPRPGWRHWAREALINCGIVILALCGLALLLGAQLIIEGSGMPGR